MISLNNSSNSTGSRLPLISIAAAAISLLLYFFSSDTVSFLHYDRNLIADGELWRIITCHWTHWSFDHLLWCTITFLALACICEHLNRKAFIATLAVSSIIIPAASWVVDPDMLYYRGLSGICSSVFIVGAILMTRKGLAEKDRVNSILPAVGGILFCAKTVYEFINGQAVFVHTNNIFSPVPLVHLTGGIIGLLTVAFILSQARQTPLQKKSPQALAL